MPQPRRPIPHDPPIPAPALAGAVRRPADLVASVRELASDSAVLRGLPAEAVLRLGKD